MLPNLILLLFVVQSTKGAFMRNKHDVELESYEMCPENNKTVNPIRNLKFSRYNRTHKALSYDITYNRALDDTVGGSVILEKWGDGGWIVMPFASYQRNVCKYMLKHFKAMWVSFYEHVGLEHPDQCPIPKGNYTVKNFLTSTEDIQIPFWSGRFRFTTRYEDVDTKEVIFCCIQVYKVVEVY